MVISELAYFLASSRTRARPFWFTIIDDGPATFFVQYGSAFDWHGSTRTRSHSILFACRNRRRICKITRIT